MEPINIILSPEYYWVRIFELPLQRKNEVLKVIPGLFEDFIDIANVKFYVQKLSKNRYLSFAYEENKIIEAIHNANIDLKLVNRICFAQIEFLEQFKVKDIDTVKIDGVYLSLTNDIIVKIPENINIQVENTLDVKDMILSKEFISLNSTNRYIDKKTSIMLSVFLLILSFILFIKLIFHYEIIDKYEENIYKVIKVDNKSLSNLQLQSIIKRYKKNYNNQINTRNMLFYFLNIGEKMNIKIVSLVLENQKLKVAIKNNINDKHFNKKIRSYIEKKYKNSSITSNTNNLIVEIKL